MIYKIFPPFCVSVHSTVYRRHKSRGSAIIVTLASLLQIIPAWMAT